MISVLADFPIHESWDEIIKTFIEHKNFEDYEYELYINLSYDDKNAIAKITDDSKNVYIGSEPFFITDKVASMKIAIYKALKQCFQKDLPWGTLTGIRPVSYFEFNIRKYGREKALDLFRNSYQVRDDKIKLVEDIAKIESEIIKSNVDNYLVYCHIPFCATRCSYCSFAVMTLDKFGKWMNPYIDGLVKEINEGVGLIEDKRPISIYIGGGTPSTMSIKQTELLLKTLNNNFPNINELTFEAGRPETITDELMDILKRNKVTRISINPQSMKQSTLDLIGRKHKVEDIYRAFEIAKEYEIDINTDMIIGLEGENMEDVQRSLNKLIELDADNITIHSLALKSGSRIKNERKQIKYSDEFDRAKLYDVLRQHKYIPYYLYRQKRQVGEAENIGFTKIGKENIFNVLSMSDKTDVLAFGMGAVSKFVDKSGNCHRVFGFRDIIYYLEHLDELIEKKKIAYSLSISD